LPYGPGLSPLLEQENLRNRVSFTATKNLATDAIHYTASFYTYDIHGNVDTLLQDYKGITEMDGTDNRFKMITYDYDLISGKVNRVSYQPDKPDAFYHRYNYDADNRLLEVETSRDKILWERDARYSYYKYGPLARSEYGQLRVQGMDYAYTIQGWLKGVNSTAISTAGVCPPGSVMGVSLTVTNRAQYDQPAVYTAQQEINFDTGFESNAADAFETEINPAGTVCNPAEVSTPFVQGDMGRDGDAGYTLHAPVARDAYGFALNYFNNDYKPIDINVMPFANGMHGLPQLSGDGVNTGAELFNGNIASMLVNIPKLSSPSGGGQVGAVVYGYRYDQLNRITGMNAYSGFNNSNNTFTPTAIPDYRERISYDPNGNILTYLRNGSTVGGTPQAMDNLTYQYPKNQATGKPLNNRLRYVHDQVNENNYSEDIDSQTPLTLAQVQAEQLPEQSSDNYSYDEIGNLVKDTKEGITNIQWTVYGKISRIIKVSNSQTTTINYTYDAGGNRISKTVIPPPAGGDGPATTLYVRDASGNVMTIYEKQTAQAIVQTENHLYGSSRVGMATKLTVAPTTANLDGGFGTATISTFTRNEKLFELSNHLGNVLVTVSDKKLGVDANTDGVIDYYNADVITANDYSSFGASLPGREYNFDKTVNGFNGQRRDKDIQKDHHTALFWEYDPRIGRRWNIDPVPKSMVSPYVCLGNNPIMYVDPNGADWYKNKKTGGYDWFDGSGRHKGYKHMETGTWSARNAKNISYYFGDSKDGLIMDSGNPLETVTVFAKGGKKKPGSSIISRSTFGRNLQWSVNRGRELQPYQDIYTRRKIDGLPLKQDGDPLEYTLNFTELQTGYKVRNAFREGGAIAAGFFLAPFAVLAAAESGATYYIYQGGQWIVRKYGVSFMQEVAKEGIANRGNLGKMDWSDIFVSTISSRSRLPGAHGLAEMINATSDLSIDGGYRNSFLIGTKYEKRMGNTVSDLFFGGMRAKYSGTFSEMSIDQIQTQYNKLVGF
jgi:RHS repeat-associated protein